MNKFYVYKHINKKTNEVFYIGKGSGKRAYDKINRNKNWIEYTKNNEYYVTIFKDSLTEDEAYDMEIDEIKKIGLDKLTNISSGGRYTFYTIPEKDYEIGRQYLNNWTSSFKNKSNDILERFDKYCLKNYIKNKSIYQQCLDNINKKMKQNEI